MMDCSDFRFVPLYGGEGQNVWRDERIWEVNRPGIYTSVNNKFNAFVLICPGGAYRKLNPLNEGITYARWFNELGVSAGVLISRLPNRSGTYAPLEDIKRAMFLLKNVFKFGRIGVMGFSAGGHLATMAHSNFLITVSPVTTMCDPWTHVHTRENLIGENTHFLPNDIFNDVFTIAEKQIITNNAFMVHAQDDKTVSVMNSVLLYQNLLVQNISTSLHLLSIGGHSPKFESYSHDLSNWLREINVV